MMNKPFLYRAAIVGLGQVGLLFDSDPKRSGVWTHFTAYEKLSDRFQLVAACDPLAERCLLALNRKPDLRIYKDLSTMMSNESLDIVSLCTPVEYHAEQIIFCSGKVRAVICEKPLGVDSNECKNAVEACEKAGSVLAVNYYKRYDGVVPLVKTILSEEMLGTIRSATMYYSGPLDAVCSHAVDLLLFLLGPIMLKEVCRLSEDRISAILTFGREGMALLHCTGPREDLIFELDIIGSDGRVRILDNANRYERYRFAPSQHYGGYRELFPCSDPESELNPRFLPLFHEVADILDGQSRTLTASGRSALDTQSILNILKGAQIIER